jgi:hypothetical protein
VTRVPAYRQAGVFRVRDMSNIEPETGYRGIQFGYSDIRKLEIICNLEFGYWNLV